MPTGYHLDDYNAALIIVNTFPRAFSFMPRDSCTNVIHLLDALLYASRRCNSQQLEACIAWARKTMKDWYRHK